MTYRATVSCDQPDCTMVLTGTQAGIDYELRQARWTSEAVDGTWRHTCPNHGPDVLSMELHGLISAGTQVLDALRMLDGGGYYVASCPHYGERTPQEQQHNGDGCVLHVYLLENEYPTGPYVQITQVAHRIRARLYADDGTVVLDEWAEQWDD